MSGEEFVLLLQNAEKQTAKVPVEVVAERHYEHGIAGIAKIFGSDEDEIEQGIANVMAMFGGEADSIAGRRLNACRRDTSNALALESVLQLLDWVLPLVRPSYLL